MGIIRQWWEVLKNKAIACVRRNALFKNPPTITWPYPDYIPLSTLRWDVGSERGCSGLSM